MDISLLSKMIGELLLDHEEVGLPGLGAFMAEMVPASFSDRGYTINPPYRRVSFIPSRSEDDSLVQLYSRSNGIDYDQAKAILQHFLEETKKRLIDEKVVVFPGLGRLRSTRQNNFFFITDPDLDIFPDGFGLPTVSLKNHTETPSEVREHVEELVAFVEGDLSASLEMTNGTLEMTEGAPGMTEETSGMTASSDANAATEIGAETEELPLIELAEPAGAAEADAVPEEVPASEETALTETESAKIASEVEPAEPSEPASVVAEMKKDEVPASEPYEPAAPAAPEKNAEPQKPVKPKKPRKPFPKWLRVTLLTILILAVLAAVALAAFVVLAQAAPDFIDSILYTPEELSIINYQ